MSQARFAIILYTVREPAKEDLVGTLKKVRESGFEYVQWSGMPEMPAEQARKALDQAGLTAVAGHMSIVPFEEDFEQTLAFWRTLGVTDIAPGGMMKDCKDSLEDWRRGCGRLDAVGAKLQEAGIRLSYHNHNHEFEKFPDDDRCKLDILYEETDPQHVRAELDLGWCHAGGADPAAYIRKYAGRCPVVHAKDMKADPKEGECRFAELGKGVLDWDPIFEAGEQAGIEWYIYEQDQTDGDLWESVQTSHDFLKSRLG